ncbi:3-hydroxyacyl-CoA dehydrogenase type II [Heterostelium album PN500]|uniref:3-hydroxyacyl-CoA dehydrogenase type II n=1 Tax=Heterostelium pallidum (strain ATCC 26659 / Pp 5 / PN500) TaxID=670386 RepID=D3BUV0_HETP5|nr:3-hydroxyacyl-CoA dehydrogenase type II [Heterostelium album PN500]EFA74888.1 3-hydroxyacyl-CoA dehydrogenase type II [Heterostelium album PN500]|eukprot:XP_020427022.1 3-hydroxyacyl-CoA dehydrogenase type II [Heterostelium album PN500]
MKLENKTFIVTGGASGLGEATVRELHKRNANVVIFDMNDESGNQLVKELGGERALFQNTDITNEASVKNAIKETLNKFKKIHGAINCAGIAVAIRTLSKKGVIPLDVYSRVININLTGTFNVIRLVAEVIDKQEMVDGEKGVFVMTASCAAFEGQQGQAAYSASKAGVVGMTLPLAREFAPLGMRIMTIAPGTFDTPMLSGLPDAATKAILSTIPFPNRFGKTNEFAQLVVHIIENQYLNGSTIRLDGALRLAKL